MSVDGFNALQRVTQSKQVVSDHQTGFADDVQRRVKQQVERARHDAFSRIFYRDHAVTGASGRGRAEHFINT